MSDNASPLGFANHFFGRAPDSDTGQTGPRITTPLALNFAAVTKRTFDLQREITEAVITNIQVVFINNSKSAQALTVAFASGLSYPVPAGKCAFLPALDTTFQNIVFSVAAVDANGATAQFINVPMPFIVW